MGCGHSEPTTIEPIDKLDNDYEKPSLIHLTPKSLSGSKTEAEEHNILNEAYEAILELGVLEEFQDPPPSSPPIKKVDDAPPPGVVEHPATPEKLQEEPEDVEEMHENEAEPNNETAEDETKEEEATEKEEAKEESEEVKAAEEPAKEEEGGASEE